MPPSRKATPCSDTPHPLAPTRLALAATDVGSGVAQIEYRVNGGDWKTYAGELRVRSRDLVEARATDHAGNTSAVLTVNRRWYWSSSREFGPRPLT
ncbi:OmpL47-type beta-barrel domain-containing protein [Glycomyces rhizosphaerae]|uniref:OmpL47-type beta-barrel domain-containing protein n=1 Tax=Glycomyces rhizosphaerae TaxID=2054422 RepID=A0ABV7Q3Q2_9ACTN